MKIAMTIMLIIVGIIHLLPMSGALGSPQLTALYGLDFSEPNLQLLMRHRAVLFGLLGVYLIFSAFRPLHQPTAVFAGFVSVLSYMGLTYAVGETNRQLQTVFTVDAVALILLILSIILYFLSAPTTS